MDSAARRLAEFNRNYLVEPTLGLYVIDDPSESINTMYERATLAARECKKTYLQHLCYYEPEMSSRIQEEQQIVHEMHSALDSGQFVVYLQPKYNLSNEQPYGAEALIRWQHPQRGLLSPGSFIPVFERNGLIGKVDRYMWEQVCMLLRKWLDEGRTPAPISVNVSRVNMYNPNLIGVLTGLLEQYRLSPALLNLELTESVYMDNPDLMGKTVRALQQAGFVVMMDDFGSGYSSLNVLQNIPVDVLKIDMKFLADETASTRNECILASVIRMAGWLETPVIMEGVETSRQVDFLKSIGCSYVQGYYYAKPMPVSDYEALISRSDAVPVRSRSENHDAMFHTIWSSSPQIDLLFNSIRQPAAIYEFSGGVYHALRVNTSFSQIFGYGLTPEDNTVLPYRHLKPEEQEKVTEAFLAAASTRKESRCDYVLPKPHRRGRVIRLSLQYWGSNEDSDVLFALFSDITCLSE